MKNVIKLIRKKKITPSQKNKDSEKALEKADDAMAQLNAQQISGLALTNSQKIELEDLVQGKGRRVTTHPNSAYANIEIIVDA